MALPITLGADPEFFLESKLSGRLKSAIGQVGGTKEQPKQLSRSGFFVQEDNVAVEFNIPPAKTVKQFVESIDWSVKTISEKVGKQHLGPKPSAAELFPSHELLHPNAQVFGCDPDFNAWYEGAINPRPSADDPTLRSCGGHVHVGIARKVKDQDALIWSMVKAMDLYLGVPSVMMDHNENRRKLYGQAGAYRPQRYAPLAWEYRVLSNFWIWSPDLSTWVFEQSKRAINRVWKMGYKKFNALMESEDLGHQIQCCINRSEVNLAQRLIVDHDLVVV